MRSLLEGFFTEKDFDCEEVYDQCEWYRHTPMYAKEDAIREFRVLRREVSNRANQLLREWLKKEIRVFGNYDSETNGMSFDWTVGINKDDDAQAFLVEIRKLEGK